MLTFTVSGSWSVATLSDFCIIQNSCKTNIQVVQSNYKCCCINYKESFIIKETTLNVNLSLNLHLKLKNMICGNEAD